MKIFKITLSYTDPTTQDTGLEAVDARFFFQEEDSAQTFFRWLCVIFGQDPERYQIDFQSDIDSASEPPVGKGESICRTFVWDLWKLDHSGFQDLGLMEVH